MGSLRHQARFGQLALAFSSIFVLTSGLSARAEDTITPSGFGPSFQAPSGVSPIGQMVPPCLALANMANGGDASTLGLTDSINQIANILRPKKKGSGSSALSCSSRDLPSVESYKSCGAFQDSSGSYSDKAAKSVESSLTALQSNYSSCSTKLDTIKQQIACIQQAETTISQAVSTFGTQLNQALSQFQQSVSTQNQKIADVKSQLKMIATLLGESDPNNRDAGGGDPNNGLVALQTRLESLATGDVYQKTLDYQQKHDGLVENRLQFQSKVASFTLAQVKSCFNTVQADATNLHCSMPGTQWSDPNQPLSPKDYIECMYQKVNSGVNGTNEQNVFSQGHGTRAVNELDAAMNAIYSNTPSDKKFALDPQTSAPQMAQFSLTTTYSGMTQMMGALSSYGSLNGVSVQGYVQGWMDHCYAQVQNQVQAALNDSATGTADQVNAQSDLHAGVVALKEATMADQSSFNQLTNQYANEFIKDARQVFGTANNMSVASFLNQTQCSDPNTNANANVKTCFDNLKANMNSLLNQQPIPVNIPSKFNYSPAQGGTAIAPFTCPGVSGCIQALRDLRDKTETPFLATLDSQKKQYVSQAQSYVTNSLISPSTQALNTMAQQARSSVQALASQLSALGISGSITLPSVKGGKSMDKDEDGLPKIPEGSPPDGGIASVLPSIELSDAFQAMNDAVSKGKSDVSNARNKLVDALAQVKSEEASCQNQGNLKSAARSIQNFIGQCPAGKNPNACSNAQGGGQMSDLISSLAGFMGGSLDTLANTEYTNLTGWVSDCKNAPQLSNLEEIAKQSCCQNPKASDCTMVNIRSPNTGVLKPGADANSTQNTCGLSFSAWNSANIDSSINSGACDISSLDRAKSLLTGSSKGDGSTQAGAGD